MKNFFILTAGFFLILSGTAQPFSRWIFEGNVETPSLGAGTLTKIGGITSTYATGNGSPTAYNTAGFPSQGTNSGTAGVVFSVSTVGRTGIIIGWAQRHSNSSSRYVKFEYSIDGGTNWLTPDLAASNTAGTGQGIDYDNDLFYCTVPGQFTPRYVDLSGITGIDDNANFEFRIVSVFAPGSAEYVSSNGPAAYSVAGTLRYDDVTTGANGILPVRLVSFSGFLQQNNLIKLCWQTLNESNFSYFGIERATDGNSFSEIASVNALNAPSGSAYQYTDHSAKSITNFYRLRMADKDGSAAYSAVITVNINPVLKLTVAPDPVTTTLIVSHPKATSGSQLQVITMEGKRIANYAVQHEAMQTAINVSGLKKGNYILAFCNGSQTLSIKFIRQ